MMLIMRGKPMQLTSYIVVYEALNKGTNMYFSSFGGISIPLSRITTMTCVLDAPRDTFTSWLFEYLQALLMIFVNARCSNCSFALTFSFVGSSGSKDISMCIL